MRETYYTRADVEAWLAENPWDMDVPEDVFTTTLGFTAFVLHRRTAEHYSRPSHRHHPDQTATSPDPTQATSHSHLLLR